MERINISPDMIRQARERVSLEQEDLLSRFSKIAEWESGEVKPTLKQLEKFAKTVYLPFGYLFLPNLPEEKMPIPDFRTFDNRKVIRPSPNLLDMIYACQERQSWYRDFAQISRQEKHNFIGSAKLSKKPADVADNIRKTIGFTMDLRLECQTWEDALRLFIKKSDEAGILVMVSGVVLSNTQRKLDCNEFRGFVLADSLAPLVFINGSDSKSGQMFTLAHELAHLWLNSTGVSNASAAPLHGYSQEEVWCNAVAAELLVPMTELLPQLRNDEGNANAISRLSKYFKVSSLVIIRRLFDARWLSEEEFNQAWETEKARLQVISEKVGSGGDFYRSTIARVSRRLTQAIVISTLEGQTLYRDAFRMLGVSKTNTFNELGREVGVML